MDSPLPYPAETEVYIDRGISLHRELGMSYALAAFDPACSDSRAKAEDKLPHAVYRAFEHWGQVLLWTAQIYRVAEEEFWLILYRLYRLAEARNVLAVRLDNRDESEPCNTSGGLFKRALLFSLANVRRLRQRDMSAVFRLLGELGDRARLEKDPVLDGQMAEFFLDIGGRRPPLRTRGPSDAESGDARFLHTRALARALIEWNEASAGGALKPMLEKSVLVRVARSLGGLEKRKSTRRAETDACWCVTGVAALAGALSSPQSWGEGGGRPGFGARPTSSVFELEREEEGKRPDSNFEARILRSEAGLGKMLGKKRSSLAMFSSSNIWSADSREAAPMDQEVTPVEGMIVNSSSRGCCIIWPTHPSARTKVGEVIGVWLGVAKQPSFIGTIRWLECDSDGLTLGVELLSPSARVVDVYDNASKPKGKSLFMGADPVLRSVPELLAIPGGIKTGSVVRIRSEDSVASYWAREVLESTPSFVRYALMEMGSELDSD